MKNKKVLIASLLIIVIIAIALISGCGKKSKTPPYETVAATRGDIRNSISSSGRVEAKALVSIKSEIGGTIQTITVDEGDTVKKGQIIATLQSTDAELGYREARVNYELKKNDYERQKNLYDKNFISKSEMEQASLAMEMAEISYLKAKESLEDTKIYAPMSGIVVQKLLEAGDVIAGGKNAITSGNDIMTIADLSKKYVRVNLDEIDITNVKTDMDVNILVDAFPEDVFRGKVVRVCPMASLSNELAYFDILAEVFDMKDKLKINMSADIEFIIGEKKDIVMVPTEALKGRNGHFMVLVLEPGRTKPTPREVKTGIEANGMVEVISGVNEGDNVVTKINITLKKTASKSIMPRPGRRR